MVYSRLARGAALVLALAAASRVMPAQSAQRWSLQVSALAASDAARPDTLALERDVTRAPGIGVETQLRFTPAGRWSAGLGWQYTRRTIGDENVDGEHTITLSGVFLEPRLTVDIKSDRVAPYLAGRLALLSQRSATRYSGESASVSYSGRALGVGGGLLIRGTRRLNIDVGAALAQSWFDRPSDEDLRDTFRASSLGFVAKAGLSIGFGGR